MGIMFNKFFPDEKMDVLLENIRLGFPLLCLHAIIILVYNTKITFKVFQNFFNFVFFVCVCVCVGRFREKRDFQQKKQPINQFLLQGNCAFFFLLRDSISPNNLCKDETENMLTQFKTFVVKFLSLFKATAFE